MVRWDDADRLCLFFLLTLLDLQYLNHHTLNDVGKQRRHVVPHRHISDHFLQSRLLAQKPLIFLDVCLLELDTEFLGFTPGYREEEMKKVRGIVSTLLSEPKGGGERYYSLKSFASAIVRICRTFILRGEGD